jgi:hypothetical protein
VLRLSEDCIRVAPKSWNELIRKLQEINAATFNFDSPFEFLCSAASTESKYIDINRNLFKQALRNSGNVTVLMVGTNADKAAAILSEIMKIKMGKVWVTSRPVQTETETSKGAVWLSPLVRKSIT